MPETPKQLFKRIAAKRANRVIKDLSILSNCAERKHYDYSDGQIDKIFSAIENATQKARGRFAIRKVDEIKL